MTKPESLVSVGSNLGPFAQFHSIAIQARDRAESLAWPDKTFQDTIRLQWNAAIDALWLHFTHREDFLNGRVLSTVEVLWKAVERMLSFCPDPYPYGYPNQDKRPTPAMDVRAYFRELDEAFQRDLTHFDERALKMCDNIAHMSKQNANSSKLPKEKQPDGVGNPPAADPYADLRKFASSQLKGQERAVVEALCDAGGELSIADLAVKEGVGWHDPFQGFKDARRRLNKKLKPRGWQLKRQNNAGFLVPFLARKSRQKAPI